MKKYNKKAVKNQRESQLMNCCNKLKKDYDFMNHFQLEEFFTEQYLVQEDNERRENLKIISEKLIKIDDVINR